MKVVIQYRDDDTPDETVYVDELREMTNSLGLIGDGTFAGRIGSRFIPYDRIKEFTVER